MTFTKSMGFVIGAIALSCASFTSLPASAADRVVSFGNLPQLAETKDKGILVNMVKALDKSMGGTSDIGVFPFPRSIDNVTSGKAAYHLPELEDPKTDPASLPFDLSEAKFFEVPFVLYSNKGKNISVKDLAGKKIETSAAHTRYFQFKITGSSCFECSLKKVDAGRIDGFIFAMWESDSLVKKNNLKNIKRELYQMFDVRAILPKGQRGGATDKYLTEGVAKLTASGDYAKLMGPLLKGYVEWQP
jgi:polar amino acid transport system substrate-binding protein